jgi:hypothetical protein
MKNQNSHKIGTESADFDLGSEWNEEEIKFFLDRCLTRHQSLQLRQLERTVQ